jgi:hypothetical protein
LTGSFALCCADGHGLRKALAIAAKHTSPVLRKKATFMTTRRKLIATAAFAGVAASSTSTLAQAKQADFLFVQNAASMSYADGKLVL